MKQASSGSMTEDIKNTSEGIQNEKEIKGQPGKEGSGKETDQGTDKEADERTGKKADKETSKETDQGTGKKADKETSKEVDQGTGREADKETSKKADQGTDREKDKAAGKKTGREVSKEIDRETEKEGYKEDKNVQETKDQEGKNSTGKIEENKSEADQKTGKKKKTLIPISIFAVLILVCGCIYSVIAYSYQEKFLPGTWVNGIDCAEMDGAQVAGLLENQLQTYSLGVTGRNYADGALGTVLGEVAAGDINLTYGESSREAVDDLLAEQNIFTWLYRKLSNDTYSYQLSQGVSYDEGQLRNLVNGWEACQPDNMIAPQNAYISEYSRKLKGYEVVPEVEGTKFDVERLVELMNAAILSQKISLDLEAAGIYEEPTVRQDAAELTEAVETANKWLGARITYDWNGAEVLVDAELLHDWITMGKDGPVLDEAAVAAFVKEQAAENDTYGKRKSFVTTLGVELSLPRGRYGWLTDQEAERSELIELIRQGKTVSREPVYANTARQKGMNDVGNSYVEADLTHQHLYLYEGGTIIFETDFVSGNMSSDPGCVTPEGVFGITYKTTNAVLRGANYETPVSYWMPFYGNYGMHDATWRSEFGGQIYITSGSHGCINLPLDSAAAIYEHMSTGFPVICYYYQVDPLAQPVEENWDDEE